MAAPLAARDASRTSDLHPSACGGRGSCACARSRAGGGGAVATEALADSGRTEGDIRLACQVKVARLQYPHPRRAFQVKQYRARVADLTDLTHDIKQVTLDLEDPQEIHFKAGQYIQLEVPPYALTDEPVYRAYSVASGPADTRRIELEIRYVPNGICTTYVHKHLRVGDTVTLNGPYGEFGLTDSDAEMLCIAGGSGMAPIKSILTEMARTGNPRRCRYFFGARARRDLFLLEFMRELEKTLPFPFILRSRTPILP